MPIAMQYGIDPIHFGMVLVMNFALANITPPVGLSLIAGCSITDKEMGIEAHIPVCITYHWNCSCCRFSNYICPVNLYIHTKSI